MSRSVYDKIKMGNAQAKEFVSIVTQNDPNLVTDYKEKYMLIDFAKFSDGDKNLIQDTVSVVTDRKMLETLITNGYDVNFGSGKNNRPSIFYSVLARGDIELSKLCLKHGGNIHKTDTEDIMDMVVNAGNKEVLKFCLQSELDTEKRQLLVNRLLQKSLAGRKIEEKLHKSWFSVSGDKLRLSATNETMVILKILLSNGALINAVAHYDSSEQQTSLIMACEKGNLPLVQALLECGADVNQATAQTNPLYAAMIKVCATRSVDKEKTYLEIIKILIANGGLIRRCDGFKIKNELFDPNLTNKQDILLFIWLSIVDSAVRKKFHESRSADDKKIFKELVKTLLARGLSMNATYSDICNAQHTPLTEACMRGDIFFVQILVESGVVVNCATDDTGPLHAAICKGSTNIMRYLLDQPDIDVNLQTLTDFETPLHAACRKGNLSLIEMLLQKGALMSISNKSGEYPCNVLDTKLISYLPKVIPVVSLIQADKPLIAHEHKFTQSLDEKFLQFDEKIAELKRELGDKMKIMKDKMNEVSQKLQENECKLSDMELQQSKEISRTKKRYSCIQSLTLLYGL